MYQPGMLIVGTRGRSLGGLQGLVNTRTSFSKYCLQYSPVPVVVVRPTEKRMKKREKRAADATRKTYADILRATGGKHEIDVESFRSYRLQAGISADEEAHHVARVLGLPAKFDPTIKPLNPELLLRNRIRKEESCYGTLASLNAIPSPSVSQAGSIAPSPSSPGPAADSGEEEGEEEEDEEEEEEEEDEEEEEEEDELEGAEAGPKAGDEFKVVSGKQAVGLSERMKLRLHDMEMNEAAALKRHGPVGEDEED